MPAQLPVRSPEWRRGPPRSGGGLLLATAGCEKLASAATASARLRPSRANPQLIPLPRAQAKQPVDACRRRPDRAAGVTFSSVTLA